MRRFVITWLISSFILHTSSLIYAATTLPVAYDLTCYRGSDCRRLVVLTDSFGSALKLDGYAFPAVMRAAVTSTSSLATFTSTVNRDAGTAEVWLPAATATTLSGKAGVWEVQMIEPSGRITSTIRGNCIIRP